MNRKSHQLAKTPKPRSTSLPPHCLNTSIQAKLHTPASTPPSSKSKYYTINIVQACHGFPLLENILQQCNPLPPSSKPMPISQMKKLLVPSTLATLAFSWSCSTSTGQWQHWQNFVVMARQDLGLQKCTKQSPCLERSNSTCLQDFWSLGPSTFSRQTRRGRL